MTVPPDASGLTDLVEGMRVATGRIAAAVEAALAAHDPTRRGDLDKVEAVVRDLLGDREVLVHGGGFVSAPGVLADAPWWLEWFAWDSGSVQRLVSETDPAGAHFFDYTLMPWYAGPRDREAPDGVVTGPYVDYLCTDDYTLTFTRAVRRPDGSFAGVAGVDVRVSAVEHHVLAGLRATGRVLALVNEAGRVVVSTSAALLSGDLVDDVDVPGLLAASDPRLVPVAGSELALLDLGER
ncbi:cache domain-containing protein [Nocardioides aestuarii]|uniref:Cache domain-containing protein n=1 Tax=Nocardioides aestuarii TaxID=252231 RepID=A0ABW4TM67_9ACTN